MALVPGLAASARIVVADTDTMTAMGTGDLPLLAIPRLLALADATTVAAIAPSLEPGVTSVGTSVAIECERPSPVGAEIVVAVELTEVDGRRLVFGFVARQERPSVAPEGEGAVAAIGTVERVLVDRSRSGNGSGNGSGHL
jgi:predicted thioesterase